MRVLLSRTFGILMSLEPAAAALSGVVFLSGQLTVTPWLALVFVSAASAGAALTARRVSPPLEDCAAERAPSEPGRDARSPSRCGGGERGHGYVQAMGGDIRVRSEVGRGTTFEVVLCSAGEGSPALLEAQESSPLRKAGGE